jgi:hypothetical protein
MAGAAAAMEAPGCSVGSGEALELFPVEGLWGR